MDIKTLEALERNIADAKAAESRAQGTLDALTAQAQRDFGITTIEEATALEGELAEQVRSLGQKADDELALLQAAYSEAVGT
jgi:hypothetical protein